MEKQLTPEERQANVNRLIARWKERKKQNEQEAIEFAKTPEYQAALEELRKRRTEHGGTGVTV